MASAKQWRRNGIRLSHIFYIYRVSTEKHRTLIERPDILIKNLTFCSKIPCVPNHEFGNNR